MFICDREQKDTEIRRWNGFEMRKEEKSEWVAMLGKCLSVDFQVFPTKMILLHIKTEIQLHIIST